MSPFCRSFPGISGGFYMFRSDFLILSISGSQIHFPQLCGGRPVGSLGYTFQNICTRLACRELEALSLFILQEFPIIAAHLSAVCSGRLLFDHFFNCDPVNNLNIPELDSPGAKQSDKIQQYKQQKHKNQDHSPQSAARFIFLFIFGCPGRSRRRETLQPFSPLSCA